MNLGTVLYYMGLVFLRTHPTLSVGAISGSLLIYIWHSRGQAKVPVACYTGNDSWRLLQVLFFNRTVELKDRLTFTPEWVEGVCQLFTAITGTYLDKSLFNDILKTE